MKTTLNFLSWAVMLGAAAELIYDEFMLPSTAFEQAVIFGLVMALIGIANLQGRPE